ncbi:MAG TPA: alpha/beta hydrolase [Streptosporangiaceae bacterium]
MPYVTVGEGNSGSIDLYFADHGSGPPAVLIAASSAAAMACSATWETDFRADLRKIDVPVLVVQGDADQAAPFEKTGKRVPALSAISSSLPSADGRTRPRGLTPSRSTAGCCGS